MALHHSPPSPAESQPHGPSSSSRLSPVLAHKAATSTTDHSTFTHVPSVFSSSAPAREPAFVADVAARLLPFRDELQALCRDLRNQQKGWLQVDQRVGTVEEQQGAVPVGVAELLQLASPHLPPHVLEKANAVAARTRESAAFTANHARKAKRLSVRQSGVQHVLLERIEDCERELNGILALLPPSYRDRSSSRQTNTARIEEWLEKSEHGDQTKRRKAPIAEDPAQKALRDFYNKDTMVNQASNRLEEWYTEYKEQVTARQASIAKRKRLTGSEVGLESRAANRERTLMDTIRDAENARFEAEKVCVQHGLHPRSSTPHTVITEMSMARYPPFSADLAAPSSALIHETAFGPSNASRYVLGAESFIGRGMDNSLEHEPAQQPLWRWDQNDQFNADYWSVEGADAVPPAPAPLKRLSFTASIPENRLQQSPIYSKSGPVPIRSSSTWPLSMTALTISEEASSPPQTLTPQRRRRSSVPATSYRPIDQPPWLGRLDGR